MGFVGGEKAEMKLLLIIMAVTQLNSEISPELEKFKQNKEIPKIIEKNVLTALSFFPELECTPIRFVFKKNIHGSVMQAQPRIESIFTARSKRAYQINISSLFKLVHSAVPIHQLPDSIMIGWIGHELGHVMDYEHRSNFGLIGFGLSYVFSKKHRVMGEACADTYAVEHSLGKYILETKKFILNHAELPTAYKEKIARLYLSPDAIVEKVKKLEERKMKEQKKALNQ